MQVSEVENHRNTLCDEKLPSAKKRYDQQEDSLVGARMNIDVEGVDENSNSVSPVSNNKYRGLATYSRAREETTATATENMVNGSVKRKADFGQFLDLRSTL